MSIISDVKEFGQCRCCLEDGYHEDLMKDHKRNGKREVYYNMISDCFNLFLSTNYTMSTLICALCVKELKQAVRFREQIIASEEKLVGALQSQDTVFVNVPEATLTEELDIKQEEVEPKEESPEQEDTLGCSDDCSNDALGDVGHTPVEFPIAEELIPGEAELLSRDVPVTPLPTRRSLAALYPRFHKHLRAFSKKKVTIETVERIYQEGELHGYMLERDARVHNYFTEKSAHQENAFTLLMYSNITAFKSRTRAGFPCFYCKRLFENLQKLKEHQNKTHKKTDLKRFLKHYGGESFVVYADVTDLKCTICNQNIENINELKKHLVKTHSKIYHNDFTDRVIPFKLANTFNYECQCCGFSFETFGAIERHMNTHYRNYVCTECGNAFITKYRLKVHLKSSHTDGTLFPCEDCKKVYRSQQRLKNHIDAVHKSLKRFKCPKCPERFSEYFRRQKHMVNEHGYAPLQYTCNCCNKSFDRRYTLSRHVKRDHLEIRDFQCEICSYKCFTKNELITHMIKHNGERIHECSVCKKAYARKKTLREHMRIHNNDRRFSCDVCGQAFVQKCSLKGHMKTHHSNHEARLKSEIIAVPTQQMQ